MTLEALAAIPLACSGLGLVALAVQALALRRHLARSAAVPSATPGISILKPLCGVDDGLEANLAAFAALDYPGYEVVLGVRSASDAAWSVARAAAARWPGRFRVVVQRGEPGLNPKVNQLVGLARVARHDLLVVSDSNVRPPPGYLGEIAACLEDDAVGLVTHPVVGVGERRLGSMLENLHLAGSVAPGVVAAKLVGRRDVVIGKSMALRRSDLAALGGFESVKDVLAEDYVLGLRVPAELGKRVEVARRPVHNVVQRASVSQFAARYRRWGVMQRHAVGRFPYAAAVLLNPVLFAAAGAAADRSATALAGLGAVCAAKAAVDGLAARAVRPGGFRLRQLAVSPLKDLVFGACWAHGLVRNEIDWRGTRLAVGKGTRLAPVGDPSAVAAEELAQA